MTNQERLQANNAKIEAIQQTLANKAITTGEIEITENGKHDVAKYASANVNVQPNLATKEITANGTYNASDEGVDGYSQVSVNVEDLLQWKCDNLMSLNYEFEGAPESVISKVENIVNGLDTKNVEGFRYTFNNSQIQSLSLDFTKASSVENMCSYCGHLINFNPISSPSGTVNMNSAFRSCELLEELNLINWRANSLNSGFNGCSKLTTLSINIINCSGLSSAFNNCASLTNLTLKNVRYNITISNGTTYGHLLTLDSLINTIKELWKISGSSRTLTMGSANIAKLANVYVKLIEITDEMRAEDQYIDNKAPFEVCESTDEGAMLVTEYVTTVKNWALA